MSPKRIIRSAGLAILVYGMLMILWIAIGGVWARSVATACDVLLASPGWGAKARYSIAQSPAGPALTLRLTHPNQPQEASSALAVRFRTYTPAAITLALIAATPIAWRRRAIAAGFAIAAVALFILLQAWTAAIDAIARWPGNALGFPQSLRAGAHALFVYACEVPTIAVLVPILLWAATTLGSLEGSTGMKSAAAAE